jgi:hypothetical protein
VIEPRTCYNFTSALSRYYRGDYFAEEQVGAAADRQATTRFAIRVILASDNGGSSARDSVNNGLTTNEASYGRTQADRPANRLERGHDRIPSGWWH